jgi:hypothetical protein
MVWRASGYLVIGYRLSRFGYRAMAIGLSAIGSGYREIGLSGIELSRAAVRAVLVVAGALALAVAAAGTAAAQDSPVDRGARVRSLAAGWGTAWKFGIPGYGKTITDAEFVAFHPSLGWFVIPRGEVFGEAALFAYYQPEGNVAVGPLAIGGRYHFGDDGPWLPFVSGGAGLIFTSLDVPELDRTLNFQVIYGGGVRWRPGGRNPTWRLEIRNHHISNAGTAGENLGLNALMVIGGVEWILGDKTLSGSR